MKLLVTIIILAYATSCTPTSKPNTSTEEISITNNYWKLIELNGNPIITDSIQRAAPHITLKQDDSAFHGNTGCNTMAGTYELRSLNRVTFSKIISTKMACMNTMQVESDFLNVLEQADNYIITGDTLVLNRARMAPLARFKRELMKN